MPRTYGKLGRGVEGQGREGNLHGFGDVGC